MNRYLIRTLVILCFCPTYVYGATPAQLLGCYSIMKDFRVPLKHAGLLKTQSPELEVENDDSNGSIAFKMASNGSKKGFYVFYNEQVHFFEIPKHPNETAAGGHNAYNFSMKLPGMKEATYFILRSPAAAIEQPFTIYSEKAIPGSDFERFNGATMSMELPKELMPVQVLSKKPIELGEHPVLDSKTESVIGDAVKAYAQAINSSIDSGDLSRHFQSQKASDAIRGFFVESFSRSCSLDFEIGKDQTLSTLTEKVKVAFPSKEDALTPDPAGVKKMDRAH